MRRWFTSFCALVLVGGLLWPWMRQIGLARLPGDLELDVGLHTLHLPFATALLISVVIAGVWRLLDRP
jgi:Protein of unknown function (DUF2905)